MSLFVLKEREKKGRSQEVFWVAQMASNNAGFAPGKMIMGVLSNRVSKSQVLPGDHIYSWRSAYTYAHHGSCSLPPLCWPHYDNWLKKNWPKQ
jgi:hypothetical protein